MCTRRCGVLPISDLGEERKSNGNIDRSDVCWNEDRNNIKLSLLITNADSSAGDVV